MDLNLENEMKKVAFAANPTSASASASRQNTEEKEGESPINKQIWNAENARNDMAELQAALDSFGEVQVEQLPMGPFEIP